jgi:hypothetical protein
MAKKKLAKVQDIPGMKIYDGPDGPDGPEMYATDPRYYKGADWLNFIWEAKRICRKVKITYLESPEAEPQTLVIAPYKPTNSVNGWEVGDLPSKGFECKMYSLANIIAAEITDETFKDPYADPAYVVAESNYFLAKRSAINTIKDNIDKISLRELGLGDDVDIRIWEAMLPQIRKHINDEPSIFDGIQCDRQFEGYSEASIALLESAVIDPCLDEYWEINEKGAYTSEWTEKDVSEFKENIKARWSYIMWLANEAMNGTLNEHPEKILDEAWERDFKIMCLLCGRITALDVPTQVDDNDSFPELPF